MPDAGATVEWIRPEEVPGRADHLRRRLEATRPSAATESSLATIERSLPQLRRDLDTVVERANEVVTRATSPVELEDINRELSDIAAPLEEWKENLLAEAQRVATVLDEIAGDERAWSATRSRPETLAAGDIVERRVEWALQALASAAADLRDWRARIIAVSDLVIDRCAAADVTLEKLKAASARERESILVPDDAPLWSRGFGAALRRELPRAPAAIRAYAANTAEYIGRDPRPLIVQVALAALLMFAFGRFASRAARRMAGESVAAHAVWMLERPYSIALMLALILSPVFHPLAPRRLMQLLALLALVPAARIIIRAAGHANAGVFACIFAALTLDRIGLAVQALPALERFSFILALVIATGLALSIARRAPSAGRGPWLRRAATLTVWGLALALVAEIGGWTYLASLLGRGIIGGAIAGIYVYATVLALGALCACVLVSPMLRRSHLLGHNTVLLQRRIESGLRWLGIGLWFYLLVSALGLRTAALDAARTILHSGITIGALSLSIGGALAFAFMLFASFLLARVVAGILEEDVYPRTHLPRGVPYAISTLARYGVYSLGFVFALAAAGVQLSQVSILIGGLGVGIGLGLQDLVKNFAAGLTLLFERRVHVGDVVELPGQAISGRVLSIDMRASVVRTWTGAEVVVPNADLIANAVTNWTLSDRLYRLEIAVGVAYGSEPERVIEVLLDAARFDQELLGEPAPQAFFKGFGDSSLDFVVRAWTDQGYEQALPLTSRLGLAVHRKLREAGIEIPFPQRDLHLASVSPAARGMLAGGERPD